MTMTDFACGGGVIQREETEELKRGCSGKVRGRAFLAGCLNVTGVSFMLLLVAVFLPVHVPKWLGYEGYEILTDSMEPDYPAGGMVYVEQVRPEALRTGDVILYRMGTDTELHMLHRVAEIHEEDRQLITKGDANAYPDKDPVAYSRLIGRAVFFLPFLGRLSGWMRTGVGRSVSVMIFVCSLVCWVLADILQRQTGKERGKERRK